MFADTSRSQVRPSPNAISTGGLRGRSNAWAVRCGSSRRWTAAVAFALILSACSGRGTAKAYGYDFVVEGMIQEIKAENGVVTATTGAHKLRAAEGRLWVDDVDLGAIAEGDQIRMSSDGRVWVNDDERTSTD